jgi:4-carboxymuconolactone decarboxylase
MASSGFVFRLQELNMSAQQQTMVAQGFGTSSAERLPLPPAESMDDAQRLAARRLIEGPRKGVFGPFVPLLHCPALLERVAALGEQLRFEGRLDVRVRELVTCAVARHASNQFEWLLHAPLARQAGVTEDALESLRTGAQPRDIPADEMAALAFATELLASHGVSDRTYQAALSRWGERGVVELTTLVGYFAMVCWLMNVARTPGRQVGDTPALGGLPQ